MNKIPDLENEIWIPINGFEDIYQISNLGRVKSLKRICSHGFVSREKLINIKLSNSNYLCCRLFKNGKENGRFIHRLIAIHFIPNPLNKREVNHKDGNKLNNNIDNLEWVSSSENESHKHKILGKCNGEDSHLSKLTGRQVNEIKNKYKSGNYLQKNLALEYNVSKANICLIINNKKWKHLKTS